MASVELGAEPGGRLRLSDPTRGDDGEIWSVIATVEHDGLAACTKVNAHYATAFDDLITFFDDLAEHWRGWPGTKRYQSLEGDLTIAAVNDGRSHVLLSVELKGPTAPYRWVVSAEIVAEPGAAMDQAASHARLLLARTA